MKSAGVRVVRNRVVKYARVNARTSLKGNGVNPMGSMEPRTGVAKWADPRYSRKEGTYKEGYCHKALNPRNVRD
jgi:hypothetical protein